MNPVRYIYAEILRRPISFLLLWVSTLWIFQYITSFGVFADVLSNPTLNFFEKISFAMSTIINIFIYWADPRALSIIVFSFIASVNFFLMILAYRRRKAIKNKRMQTAGTVGALIGTHCIACGGSLLAPLVSTIAGSGAFFSTARIQTGILISVAINVIAIVFIARITLKMAQKQMQMSREIPLS